MEKVEFHVHTRYSKDSMLTSWFLMLMCKLRKINCVAITDHNEIVGACYYQKKLRKVGIEVIIGEEIFTRDGEIIGLYLSEKIEPGLSCEETIKQIKEQGGLVYIPHPYEPFRLKTVLREECIANNSNFIDLIEIHNGRNRNMDISMKQLHLAQKYHIRGIVGSDAHTFFEIGRNNLLVSSTSREKLLQSIEEGEIICAKNGIHFAHTWTKVVRLLKILKRGDLNELCRIINRKCKRKMPRTLSKNNSK